MNSLKFLHLFKLEKIKKKLPIVLFGEEYWNKLINFETLVEFGTINREDLDLFFLTSNVDEAYEYIVSNLSSK